MNGTSVVEDGRLIMGKVIIYAPNVRSGGGLVLLGVLVESFSNEAILFLPADCDFSEAPNRYFFSSSFFSRIKAEYFLFRYSCSDDSIFMFNGSAPLFPCEGKVSIYLQNSLFFVNTLNLISLVNFRTFIRLCFEKLWLRCRLYSLDFLIVQTDSMRQLIFNYFDFSSAQNDKIKVIPFAKDKVVRHESSVNSKMAFSFF